MCDILILINTIVLLADTAMILCLLLTVRRNKDGPNPPVRLQAGSNSSQFIEPIDFKERFKNANEVTDLLNK